MTSSANVFVRSVHPAIAIASAGRSNPLGHPARAVIERYEQIGTEIFRTDRDGAVTVDTDGFSIDVRTLVQPSTLFHHENTKGR